VKDVSEETTTLKITSSDKGCDQSSMNMIMLMSKVAAAGLILGQSLQTRKANMQETLLRPFLVLPS